MNHLNESISRKNGSFCKQLLSGKQVMTGRLIYDHTHSDHGELDETVASPECQSQEKLFK